MNTYIKEEAGRRFGRRCISAYANGMCVFCREFRVEDIDSGIRLAQKAIAKATGGAR